MKNNQLNNKLNEIGKLYIPEKELRFSNNLFKEVDSLGLDEGSLITSFFLQSDINNTDLNQIIKTEFGKENLKRIELLKRIGNISFPETRKKISDLRKLFIELTDDLTIIFVKLAERLLLLKEADQSNSSDLKKLSEECLYLYSPIAHRLGIRKIYTEMEDIAFKHLHPDSYKRLNRAIEKKRAIFQKKIAEMRKDLESKLISQGIKASIQSRVKRLYSIYMKIQNKGVSIDEIYDLMALRIITDSVEHCYISLGVVHKNWIPIEGRFRDWVSYPKPNGYRSIQTTVITRKGTKYEIQIRTEEMHREAEYGSAAHWAYKEGMTNADTWIMRLKEFLENDEYFDNPYELNELLKSEFKRNHIHVLTPKGDIKTLQEGSTPVDFAFAIHTDVGLKVTGARVNGKFAKLKTVLHSGDIVEVITNKNASPSRDWLNYVKTSKARSKILLWIKKNEKDELVAEGKRIWEKFKKRYRKKLEAVDDDQSFRNNLAKIGFKSADDLYSAISIKSLKCSQPLLRRLYPDAFRRVERVKKDDKKKNRQGSYSPQIAVEGMKYIKTTLAKCCNPIKGEPIKAYITKGASIKIHSLRCTYIKSGSFDEDRFRKAEWMVGDSIQRVTIKLFGLDSNKMLHDLAELSASSDITILSTQQRKVHDRNYSILVDTEIKDIVHINNLIDKLRKQPSIDSVRII